MAEKRVNRARNDKILSPMIKHKKAFQSYLKGFFRLSG